MDTSKIIIGTVGGGRYTVTAPIVKEDYGLYLKIEGLELPSTYEVDFSNSEHNGTSVTMIGNADGVLIPRQFITTGKDVFAFLYHVGDNYGRTVFKFRIPNKLRPDRTNEEPTPEQQSVIDQAISALNSAVAQTAQDVIDADASAQSASESAEQAQESARTAGLYSDTAQTYANSAEISANSASASATASAQSASQSAQIKDDVESMVDDAQGYATASEQSAQASANSASQASGYATSASQSASSAQGYASQAQTSAQTASTKASEASTSAQTASAKATEASQSATNAQGYAQTAEQAKTSAQTAQGLAESAMDSAQGYASDAQGYANDAQASAESISASASQIAQNTSDIASLEADRYKPYATDTASGTIASFSDGADDIPLKSLVVNIDPIQDLHGYDSPWVGGGGKNKYDGISSKTLASGGFVVGGGNLAISYRINLPAAEYKIIFNFTVSTTTECRFFKADGTYFTTGGKAVISGQNVVTINCTEDVVGIGIYINAAGTASNIMICLSSVTDYSYAPYENICPISGWTGMQLNVNGTVIPISWQTEAGTVYGGRLDVLTGKLTVYPYYASYNGETLTGRWISDRDVYAVGTTPTIGAQVVNIGAEGTEIQLEPHEVASLHGTNNIFADTGDTACEYRADTKLYIEKLTQPEEDDMIADSAITSGQFFMIGNTLYKALASIASGATITVGTNAQRVSLADALNLINT